VPGGTAPSVAGALPAVKPVSLRTMLGNTSPGGSLPRRERKSAVASPAPSAKRPSLATNATRRTPERPAAPAPPVDRRTATSKLRSLLPPPSAPVERPETPSQPGQGLLASVPAPKPEPTPTPAPPVSPDVPSSPAVLDPAKVGPVSERAGGLRFPRFLAL
jgi:hypothetical protein